ncbi:MAG: hypothetical protein CVV44_17405 [Spirochaetae bacterium HGW-Spirochaetae-1]|nr:MAG: hypothetical protein CVV44_17405 [Spirochaetae bacterium HGW-Spirochaetae-1]
MKNILKVSLILLVAMFVFSGCQTALTKEGGAVRIIMKEEPPAGAKMLATIESGMFSNHPSVVSVQNDLRNKTAELGGNLLVVDVIVAKSSEGGITYSGNGRAYKE